MKTGGGGSAMGDGGGRERLTCEQFADQLEGFLERDIDERTRASVESHALACGECGPLLADLRKLRIDAANLPELAPSRDLWRGIAARIEAPVIELPRVGDGRWAVGEQQRSSSSRRRTWMALAAAGLVAITAGVTHFATKQALRSDQASPVATQPAPAAPAAVVASNPDTLIAQPATTPAPSVARTTALQTASNAESNDVPPSPIANRRSPIDLEIARLKAIVNRRRAQLDSATLSVVDRNLTVIDDAIAQVKAALRKDPESRFLMESLNNALENKVEVLRTAAMLPSRM
jgi:hypothetical protein